MKAYLKLLWISPISRYSIISSLLILILFFKPVSLLKYLSDHSLINIPLSLFYSKSIPEFLLLFCFLGFSATSWGLSPLQWYTRYKSAYQYDGTRKDHYLESWSCMRAGATLARKELGIVD